MAPGGPTIRGRIGACLPSLTSPSVGTSGRGCHLSGMSREGASTLLRLSTRVTVPSMSTKNRPGNGHRARLTRQGRITVPKAIRDALGALPSVDLAVAYGVSPGGSQTEIAVAALTIRRDCELEPEDVTAALRSLERRRRRPMIVRVVDEIPLTTWYRPRTGPLREEGVPEPGGELPVWCLNARGDRYVPLTAASQRRLARAA